MAKTAAEVCLQQKLCNLWNGYQLHFFCKASSNSASITFHVYESLFLFCSGNGWQHGFHNLASLLTKPHVLDHDQVEAIKGLNWLLFLSAQELPHWLQQNFLPPIFKARSLHLVSQLHCFCIILSMMCIASCWIFCYSAPFDSQQMGKQKADVSPMLDFAYKQEKHLVKKVPL